MESSICSQDKRVNLYFVRPPEGVSSPCLLAAYQACERFQSKWISADHCLQLQPTKQDVFICDPFEGKAFTFLTSGFKCVVVGPRCILSCLHRVEPIPQLPSPIHNTAMRGLVITTTGFDKNKKLELKSLVERMAGIYSADYHLGVTHLVANEVGSKKYQVAVEQDIPIMTGEWVMAVWQAVTKDHTNHILATDERFLSHTCPVLYGMTICVSQLDRNTKTALKGIIEENGGTYSVMLEMSKTSVLIVSAPEGEKYSHACKWRIKCLTPDWIYDSVQRGHALQMEGYEVKKQKHSTPNNSQAPVTALPDVSQCSGIVGDGGPNRTSSVDETMEVAEAVAREKKQTFSKEVELGLEAMDGLDLQEAQKAGLFLDGCKIFLSGFTNTHLEKLRRILNCGGATRFNQLSEAVSHMVIGKPVEEHLSLVKGWQTRPHLVYARWITESIKLKRQADEGQFTHPLEDEGVVEEARQRQRSTSRHSSSSTPAAAQCNGELSMEEEEVLRQYMKPAQTGTRTTSNGVGDSQDKQSAASRMFTNKVFSVSGYTEEMEETLIEVIEEAGGQVVPVTHAGRIHYSVMTSEGQYHPKAEEVVSHYFLEDCVNAKRLLAVEYYHVPLLLPGDTYPLAKCCVTISTYTKNERVFLENLATLLGARKQDMFAKKPNPAKNIELSTHLVCPLPSGNKYQAAKKWGVPAVSADWLIECARTASKVDETPFQVDANTQLNLPRKKIFIDSFVAIMGKRVAEEEEEGEHTSPGAADTRNNNNHSGSQTPSPNKLLSANATTETSQKDDGGNPSTRRASTPPNTQHKKVREISDFFQNPTQSADPNDTSTPSGEFYKKFYEDIKETMKKYKRKPPLQLQESGMEKSQALEGQEEPGKSPTKRTQRERTQNTQETEMQVDRPLKGVVVYSSRKFMEQWEDMSQAVEHLGGQFLHSYVPEVTHLVFQGRSNDLNREYRKAKQDRKLIVAPDWLWMCLDKNTRVDEALFPHTYTPNMSLPMTSSMKSPGSRNVSKRKLSERETEENNMSQEKMETSEETDQKNGTQLEKEKLSKQLEEIGALAMLSGKKNGVGRGRGMPPGEWQRPGNAKLVDIETQPISGEEPESQGTAITWEDPVELQARRHLQNRMPNGDSAHPDKEHQDQQECLEEKTEDTRQKDRDKEDEQEQQEHQESGTANEPDSTTDNPPTNQPLIFVLVGMAEDRRQHYSKVVEALGGQITLSPMFNPEVTHLVAESLSRSERTLAAIASGKWVLHHSYLDHSQAAGQFLEEEMYAWGNPSAEHLPSLPGESTRAQLAKAAWRWRCAINAPGRGSVSQRPFQHIVALVHSSKDRVGAFTRMIKAGGGKMLPLKPPYKNVEGITHFFVEMDKAQEEVDIEPFVSKGIPCLKPIYINNFLLMDPLPDEEDHYISQYKDLLLSMSSHNTSSSVKRQRRQ